MKRRIKILCIILVGCLVLAMPVSASNTESRASDYFVSTRTYLHQTGTYEFSVCFHVTAKRTMDELGVNYIEVQKSKDGVNWISMRTYLPSVNEQMIGENTGFWSDYVSCTGTTDYYYKANVVYYAKYGNGTGEYDTWTDTLYLPAP